MGFRPGDKKPEGSGRKKGQVSKHTLAVREKLALLNCDPIAVLAHFAKGDAAALGYKEGTEIEPDLRAKCATDLAQFTTPKLKAIEHSGTDGGPIETQTVYDTQWREANPSEEDASTLQANDGAATGTPE